jgi:hypothetical protein
MSEPYVLEDELSDIGSTCTTARTARGGPLAGAFGLAARAVASSPSALRPGPLPPTGGDAIARELEMLRDEDDDESAEPGVFADPSIQRISALESALGEANRELRARAQAEEQLSARVDELVRVVEDQRAIIAARDAEIVRLTTQATLVAEVPKSRTRHRRSNHQALPMQLSGSLGTPDRGSPITGTSVPTLPPLLASGGGGSQPRSRSSLL